MSKQPNFISQQRHSQNHRSDALNNNRGTSGSNPTNALVHGNRGKQPNPSQREACVSPVIIGRGYQGFQLSRDTCLVTECELVKLAFDAFGVLLRKEASHDKIDQTQKKTIQKQLARLSQEEGGLLDLSR